MVDILLRMWEGDMGRRIKSIVAVILRRKALALWFAASEVWSTDQPVPFHLSWSTFLHGWKFWLYSESWFSTETDKLTVETQRLAMGIVIKNMLQYERARDFLKLRASSYCSLLSREEADGLIEVGRKLWQPDTIVRLRGQRPLQKSVGNGSYSIRKNHQPHKSERVISTYRMDITSWDNTICSRR